MERCQNSSCPHVLTLPQLTDTRVTLALRGESPRTRCTGEVMTDEIMLCWIRVCMYKACQPLTASFGLGSLFEKAVTPVHISGQTSLAGGLPPLSTEATTRSLKGREVARNYTHACKAAGARSERSYEEPRLRAFVISSGTFQNFQIRSRCGEQHIQALTPSHGGLAGRYARGGGVRQVELTWE